jgi:hypothetical protein
MDPEKPNKPGDSAFKQQKLKSWDFRLSKRSLAIFYIAAGVFFLIIGSLVVVESNRVIEHKLRYDDLTECKASWKRPNECTIKLKLDEKMESPVFLYYEIANMYQNHRRYNKNRDILQLMGNTRSKAEIETNCKPVTRIEDLGLNIINPELSPKSVANPCGLVARSVFNDSYMIVPANPLQDAVNISFKDITWTFDRKDKFKNNDHIEKQWTDVENSKE